jgi:hypothetical protein
MCINALSKEVDRQMEIGRTEQRHAVWKTGPLSSGADIPDQKLASKG